MATFRIKISVNKRGDFESVNTRNSTMQTSWQSPDLISVPEVIYTRNLISMPHGVKTANAQKEFIDELNWMPDVQNSYGNDVENGKPLTLGSFLDRLGAYRYVFFEVAASPLDTTYGYFHHTGQNATGLFPFLTREFQEMDADPDVRYAVYQNRTLFLKDKFTQLQWPNTVNLQGDVDAEEAYVEIEGDAPTVTFYELQGIELHNEVEQSYKNGMCVFQNYIILWDDSRIYWNNPLAFFDYTIQQDLGGSAQITAAKGTIVTCVPSSNGIHIYCKGNIIFGQFTGDPAIPFNFIEVIGGGGINVLGGNKLVTRNSDMSYHVAFTSAGLQLIQDREAQLLPERINRFFAGSYVDFKPEDNSELERVNIGTSGGVLKTIVRSLFISQNLLFVYCAAPVPNLTTIANGRLIVYNMETEGISILHGDFPALTQRVDVARLNNLSPAQTSSKSGLLSSQFTLVRRIVKGLGNLTDFYYDLAMRVIDFSNRELPRIPTRPEDVEFNLQEGLVLIGDISISEERMTVITSIKLVGDNGRMNGLDRAQVRAYSVDVLGCDCPEEFVYDEHTDRYYGYIVGRDLKIEIKGNYFYLQHVELEIARGGLI